MQEPPRRLALPAAQPSSERAQLPVPPPRRIKAYYYLLTNMYYQNTILWTMSTADEVRCGPSRIKRNLRLHGHPVNQAAASYSPWSGGRGPFPAQGPCDWKPYCHHDCAADGDGGASVPPSPKSDLGALAQILRQDVVRGAMCRVRGMREPHFGFRISNCGFQTERHRLRVDPKFEFPSPKSGLAPLQA